MSSINKSIKINPLIVISLILLSVFIFMISNRIVFIVSNVEKILIEHKANGQAQKSFNADLLKDLKTRMPITQ